jgi:hypothetical protein
MQTFIKWLNLQEADMGRRGFLKTLGAGLATGLAAAAARGGKSEVDADTRNELKWKTNSKQNLQDKLAKDAQYNPEAAKIAVKADVIAGNIQYRIQNDTQNRIDDKIKTFLKEAQDILEKIGQDKTGNTHDKLFQELIQKFYMVNNPNIKTISGQDHPYRILDAVRDNAYKLIQAGSINR